ncbi:MAG TPA: hypothetical protein VNS81_04915 [Nocardioides sp.]|nr:hypothetical protein [Nocardioides sp.]
MTETADPELDMDTETSHDPPPSGTDAADRRPRWLRIALPILLVVVLVGALAAAAWTASAVRRERDADARDRAALAAGREAAVAFTSYDYRHIDHDLDRVSAMSTGKFRKEFTKALGALTEAIGKAHGVSQGEVTHAGVLRSHDDSAVVIAAVDATITNKESPTPSLRRYRLQITVTRSGGDWLISDIKPVA